LNVPNPVNLTSPSFLTHFTTASTKELTNSPASFLETPNFSANVAINAVFVIFYYNNKDKKTSRA
jgi:hypothetical protein